MTTLYDKIVVQEKSKDVILSYDVIPGLPILARGSIDLPDSFSGLWLLPASERGLIPKTLEIEVRVFSLFKDEDGEFWGTLIALFDPSVWDAYSLGLQYTSDYILKKVQGLLKKSGLIHYDGFEWSEQGRQEIFFMDFDLDSDLAQEIVDIFPKFAEEEFKTTEGLW